MKYQCIAMNYNTNCLFGSKLGHKECNKVDGPRIGRDKPCEDCEIHYYYWALKKEEIAKRREGEEEQIRFSLK